MVQRQCNRQRSQSGEPTATCRHQDQEQCTGSVSRLRRAWLVGKMKWAACRSCAVGPHFAAKGLRDIGCMHAAVHWPRPSAAAPHMCPASLKPGQLACQLGSSREQRRRHESRPHQTKSARTVPHSSLNARAAASQALRASGAGELGDRYRSHSARPRRGEATVRPGDRLA